MKLSLLAAAALLVGSASVMSAQTEIRFTKSDGNQTSNMGNQKSLHYDIAMKVTDPDYVGATVAGVKVMLAWGPTYGNKNYRVWVAKSLDNDLDSVQSADVTIDPFYGEAYFKTPVEIPAEGLYVGYSFDVTEILTDEQEEAQGKMSRFPVCCTGLSPEDATESFFVKTQTAGWTDYTDKFGAAPIQAILHGPFKSIAYEVGNVYGSPKAAVNEPVRVSIEITNKCPNVRINSVEYDYSIGSKKGSGSAKCYNVLRPGLNGHAIVEMPAMGSTGRKTFTINLTGINGEKNKTAGKTTVSGAVYVGKNLKRGVMEEQTGTWCGFCTRGALAMRELKNRNPQFIGIAYHASDTISVPSKDLPFKVGGYPSCRLDRMEANIDPRTNELGMREGDSKDRTPDPFNGYHQESDFVFGIEPVFERLVEDPGYAKINIDSQWNEDETELSAVTTVNFDEIPEDGPFKLGYVLIQNGICIPELPGMAQHNYYGMETKARYPGDLREELTLLHTEIPDYVYNEVAIYARNSKGVAGSIPTSVEEGVDYQHSYKIALKDAVEIEGDDYNIQDPENMELVALLINSKGIIVNARSVEAGLSTTGESGIIDLQADAMDVAPVFYDLQGRQVANPQHGIFIKRVGNKATKVVK